MSTPPVQFGDLRRLRPFDPFYGFGRGTPIDRYFIERFIGEHRAAIQGRVLEVGDGRYAEQFGRDVKLDVLDVDPGNARATIIDDLSVGSRLPSGAFDCIILTQVLQLVRDLAGAVETAHKCLTPGGTLLVTMPGITPLLLDTPGEWYWNLTTASAREVLCRAFDRDHVTVASHGNLLTSIAFLLGLATHELTEAELNADDSAYQMLITAVATRPDAEPHA